MLDQLLKIAQEQLADHYYADPQVENQVAESTANVAGSSIINSVIDLAKSGQLNGLLNMFSGKQVGATSGLVGTLMPGVVNSIAGKLGVDASTAQMLASKAVPFVLNLFNGQVNKVEHSQGVDIAGLIGNLLGGNTSNPAAIVAANDELQAAPVQNNDILSGLIGTLTGGGNQAGQANPQIDMIGGLIKTVLSGLSKN
jgi:hypothetical protein